MEYDKLTRQLILGGIEYTVVRPGTSLCLLYAEPAERIAPSITEMLEGYLVYRPNGP